VTSDNWSFLIRARRVIELLQSSGVDLRDVLDIGCGTAPVARAVAEMGARYTGVDFSREMIEGARESTGDLIDQDRVRLQVGNAMAVDFPEDRFDAVLAMGFLEYLTSDQFRGTLARVRRCVRSGGVVILTIPKRKSWPRLVQDLYSPLSRLIRWRPKGDGIRIKQEGFERLYLTPAELDGMSAEAGLPGVTARHYNDSIFCRHLSVMAPGLTYLLNRPFEGSARLPLANYFASGYIGMYRKP
jgi:ubiquinone/menaquinone biosynthesis C-methylase UbiE